MGDLFNLTLAQVSGDEHETHFAEHPPISQPLLPEADLITQECLNDTLGNKEVTGTSTTTATIQLSSSQQSIQEANDLQSTPEVDETRIVRRRKDSKFGDTSATRFKWTKDMLQVAMNLLKHGCKPKIISVAVGCSIRTAQKFVETVSPREGGQTYRAYELKRRGRKHKDVNARLEAIREVLNQDCTKTQTEIAANLKVSNTTVCRDLKKIGATWREKRVRTNTSNNGASTTNNSTNNNNN